MHRGYAKIWRKFQDHPFWKENREFSKAEAWLDIVMNVQHSDKPLETVIKMKCLVTRRGESIKSITTWAARWNWTPSKVNRFFILLKEMKMICTKNEHITTRLTILNYDTYNPERNASETSSKRLRNAFETPSETDNNVNNINNEKNEKKNGVPPFFNDQPVKGYHPESRNIIHAWLDAIGGDITTARQMDLDRIDEYVRNPKYGPELVRKTLLEVMPVRPGSILAKLDFAASDQFHDKSKKIDDIDYAAEYKAKKEAAASG